MSPAEPTRKSHCSKSRSVEYSKRALFVGNIRHGSTCNHHCRMKASEDRLGLSGQTMTFASTENKCKSEDERKASAKISDERKAGENAKAILAGLTPSSACTDRIIFVLRNAANIARTATLTRLEMRRLLDGRRTEVATALNQICSQLDRGGLTQHAIDQAALSVEAWLNALPRFKIRAAPTPPVARVS
jgi:hypothetical protein